MCIAYVLMSTSRLLAKRLQAVNSVLKVTYFVSKWMLNVNSVKQ